MSISSDEDISYKFCAWLKASKVPKTEVKSSLRNLEISKLINNTIVDISLTYTDMYNIRLIIITVSQTLSTIRYAWTFPQQQLSFNKRNPPVL